MNRRQFLSVVPLVSAVPVASIAAIAGRSPQLDFVEFLRDTETATNRRIQDVEQEIIARSLIDRAELDRCFSDFASSLRMF